MAEEANVVNEAEVVDTSSTESTPVENETSSDDLKGFDAEFGIEPTEDSATEEQPAEDQTEEVESTEETEVEQSTEDTNEDSPANKRIRELVARAKEAEERAAQYEQYMQLLQQQQQPQQGEDTPQTVEQYLDTVNPETGEYYTNAEAKLAMMEKQFQALQAERQQEQYQAQVQASMKQLETDANKVVEDFPVFNPDSPQYNKALADSAAQVLKANLIVENGVPVGSRVSPYQLYKSFADVYQVGTASGEAKGQKATANMLRNADVTGSVSAASNTKSDPYLEAFESEL